MWLYRKLRELFTIQAMGRSTDSFALTLVKAFGLSAVYFFFVGLIIYFLIVPLVKGCKKAYTKGGVEEIFKYLWSGLKSWTCWFVMLVVQIAQKVYGKARCLYCKAKGYLWQHPRISTYCYFCFCIGSSSLFLAISLSVLIMSPYNKLAINMPHQVTVIEYRYNDREIIQPCPECGYSPYSIDYQAELQATHFKPRIVLSDYNRAQAEAVVCGEAGNQSFEGKKLVAQCLWDAWTTDGLNSIDEVRAQFGYKGYTPLDSWEGATEEQKEEVREAVRAIFDREEFVVSENILYFYSTTEGLRPNNWHETQKFVIWEGDHRFFARWD